MFFRELIRDGKHCPQGVDPWPVVDVDNLVVVNDMDRHLTRLSRLYLLWLGVGEREIPGGQAQGQRVWAWVSCFACLNLQYCPLRSINFA
jgi:hypothetical protein